MGTGTNDQIIEVIAASGSSGTQAQLFVLEGVGNSGLTTALSSTVAGCGGSASCAFGTTNSG